MFKSILLSQDAETRNPQVSSPEILGQKPWAIDYSGARRQSMVSDVVMEAGGELLQTCVKRETILKISVVRRATNSALSTESMTALQIKFI
jgi:hypothetical protein